MKTRAKVGESCLKFMVYSRLEMVVVGYKMVVEDLERSGYIWR